MNKINFRALLLISTFFNTSCAAPPNQEIRSSSTGTVMIKGKKCEIILISGQSYPLYLLNCENEITGATGVVSSGKSYTPVTTGIQIQDNVICPKVEPVICPSCSKQECPKCGECICK